MISIDPPFPSFMAESAVLTISDRQIRIFTENNLLSYEFEIIDKRSNH
jgi:hypothetical protein